MPQTATGRRLLSLYQHLFRYFGPQRWWPARSRFEVIVGAILTQNTAWINVEKAITALRAARLLNPRGIDSVPQEHLATLIRPSGYYNMKAERLKHVTRFLLTRYGGSVRRMGRTALSELREELLEISGVGEETADSILLYAGDRPIFVVDAYTRRVLERHGLIAANTRYGEIQRLFMTRLPTDATLFNEYHALLVAVGKTYCRRTPNCASCPLQYDLPQGSPFLRKSLSP
ncbi:MAG TPA: endonuclease III domain-containing protein [Patescibacteria group bacterium]|nr:endonuclease III domain-containing protein [Patescibacteria group bacterium]